MVQSKYKLFLFVAFLLITIIAIWHYTNKEEVSYVDLHDDSFMQMYKRMISSRIFNTVGHEVDTIEVVFTQENSEEANGNYHQYQSYISHVVFTSTTGERYQAIVVSSINEQSKLKIEEVYPSIIDNTPPFSQSVITVASREENGEIGSDKCVVYGVVNDNRISFIDIAFSNRTLAKILINTSSSTYAYIYNGEYQNIRSIGGYTLEGELIFEY